MSSIAPPEQATDIDSLNELWELPAFENDKGWELIFIDDDHNTMEMVTILLVVVFQKTPEQAVELMLRIHNHGRAGVFKGSFEECKEKQDQANTFQQINGMDVFSVIEKISD